MSFHFDIFHDFILLFGVEIYLAVICSDDFEFIRNGNIKKSFEKDELLLFKFLTFLILELRISCARNGKNAKITLNGFLQFPTVSTHFVGIQNNSIN